VIKAPTSAAPDLAPLRRALLSVFDKTGLVDFAQALHQAGVELLSTGGSAQMLRQAGLPVKDVAEVTGFPRSWTAASRRCIPGAWRSAR
jgi:phosphoribosylaminoimidazolecarboxamide formyltransferase/IMP cyclohydrolase